MMPIYRDIAAALKRRQSAEPTRLLKDAHPIIIEMLGRLRGDKRFAKSMDEHHYIEIKIKEYEELESKIRTFLDIP